MFETETVSRPWETVVRTDGHGPTLFDRRRRIFERGDPWAFTRREPLGDLVQLAGVALATVAEIAPFLGPLARVRAEVVVFITSLAAVVLSGQEPVGRGRLGRRRTVCPVLVPASTFADRLDPHQTVQRLGRHHSGPRDRAGSRDDVVGHGQRPRNLPTPRHAVADLLRPSFPIWFEHSQRIGQHDPPLGVSGRLRQRRAKVHCLAAGQIADHVVRVADNFLDPFRVGGPTGRLV